MHFEQTSVMKGRATHQGRPVGAGPGGQVPPARLRVKFLLILGCL